MLIFDNNKPIKQKQWINTEVKFEWSEELQKYVEISSDGYWYEGDMALCGTLGATSFTDDVDITGNLTVEQQTSSPSHGIHIGKTAACDGYITSNEWIILGIDNNNDSTGTGFKIIKIGSGGDSFSITLLKQLYNGSTYAPGTTGNNYSFICKVNFHYSV